MKKLIYVMILMIFAIGCNVNVNTGTENVGISPDGINVDTGNEKAEISPDKPFQHEDIGVTETEKVRLLAASSEHLCDSMLDEEKDYEGYLEKYKLTVERVAEIKKEYPKLESDVAEAAYELCPSAFPDR